MQLSSRILTALAVLILSVSVVAVRAGTSGTVEAATGTIDVLNVGTCYTTNSDVFAISACKDGILDTDTNNDGTLNADNNYTLLASANNPAEISEVGTVYATYSHDPKTAADNPRGILTNSDLIKISIQDSERDKRTPVLLAVGNADDNTISGIQIDPDDFAVIFDDFKNLAVVTQQEVNADDDATPPIQQAFDNPDRTGYDASTIVKHISTATTPETTYTLATARWDDNDDVGLLAFTSGVKNGLRVILGTESAYLPMDATENAVIRFYGCVNKSTPSDNTAATCDANEPFEDLTNAELRLDEDRGSGRTADTSDGDGTAVAPWLNMQVHNTDIVLKFIVYHTSERETLLGGRQPVRPTTVATADPTKYYSDAPTTVAAPDFTESEDDGNTALKVRVKSDGDVPSQNLWLYETGRFTGRYEGFVRLTDADGDGPSVTKGDVTTTYSNWGLDVKDATGHDSKGAAVLGVESGPVTIEYQDTDGHLQTETITIDTVPPTIQIDTPSHKSEDQDTSPEFAGSFSDGESGLRAESFQLYVDNTNDTDESGDGASELALDLRVDDEDDKVHGYVKNPTTSAAPDAVIRSIEDYEGYSAADRQFGVVDHQDVYNLHKVDGDPDKANSADLLGVEGDRFSDGAANGTFADSVRIRIQSGTPLREVDPYNHTIDFQALVTDVAGNVGFSDSDNEGPRFINDYGKKTTGDDKRKPGRYNVLGWYARHIFFLDEKDPEIYEEQSVTGFYGIDDDKKPVVNRSGILVAFDAAVDADSVNNNTFEVKLGSASATVADVSVAGRQVYLLLSDELASDATPSVQVATGQSVLDPAGNRLTRGGQDAFDVNDGISPILSVSLSGGSGTGEGNEAADKLTNKAMTITVTSDEEINSTPSITVVCSNIKWTEGTGDKEQEKGLAEFTGDRSGPLMKASANFALDNSSADAAYTPATKYMCGDDTKEILPQQVQSFSRPGLEWEYQWHNFTGDKALSDGKLTVVAYGRDRQSYASLMKRADGKTPNNSDSYSWGVATAEFNFDTTKPKLAPTPGDGDTVTDPRPFILLNYDDKSTVSVTKFTVDKTEQTEQVQRLGAKRFLYWPESLSIDKHSVAVEAIDTAGNKSGAVEYEFKVAERATFDVKLIAGWNAVSLPANPIDPNVGSVFTESTVNMIAAWNGENPEAPWSIATRMDGEWSTHSDFATLNRITARYGYWVHAQGFLTQSVALVGKGNREDPTTVPADLVEIPTNPGWNFVGVVDQDGDQTQDNYGEVLKNGTTQINAKQYLGKHIRAYTWDALRNRFDVLEEGDSVRIGEGIWVYYGEGIAP